jgi:hypothetical protein
LLGRQHSFQFRQLPYYRGVSEIWDSFLHAYSETRHVLHGNLHRSGNRVITRPPASFRPVSGAGHLEHDPERESGYACCHPLRRAVNGSSATFFAQGGHDVTSFTRLVLAGCGVALWCGIASEAAEAQKFHDHKTDFIIDRIVELPGGRTLQPGKYVFRVVDSSAGRRIVQVLDEHEAQILATVLAVEPTQGVIVVGETPANVPQPIRSWYPSRSTGGPIGYEFVYPKPQATRIALMTNRHVVMSDGDMSDADAMMRARVETVEPNDIPAEPRDIVRSQELPTLLLATLIGLTVLGLGVAVIVLRFHHHVRPRPLGPSVDQLGPFGGFGGGMR